MFHQKKKVLAEVSAFLFRRCRAIGLMDFVLNSPRPRIDARHFKSVVPCSGIGALVFRARAHAMPVRLAVLPTAAECSAILEIESAATDLCSLLGTGLLRL